MSNQVGISVSLTPLENTHIWCYSITLFMSLTWCAFSPPGFYILAGGFCEGTVLLPGATTIKVSFVFVSYLIFQNGKWSAGLVTGTRVYKKNVNNFCGHFPPTFFSSEKFATPLVLILLMLRILSDMRLLLWSEIWNTLCNRVYLIENLFKYDGLGLPGHHQTIQQLCWRLSPK